VFDAAARSSDALFTVLASSNNRDYPRLGLAIGRKRMRRAVNRNRCKRLIRESFRHHLECLAGLDLVVLARSNGEVPNAAIFSSLSSHWKRLMAFREQGKVPAAEAARDTPCDTGQS